jgi:hypothetical protein
MQREHGYRFSIAPRFANSLDWRERLQVGRRETSWRPASESECALLVANDATEETWRQDICLFSIPEHLRAKWWNLAARQIETLPARLDGMEPFAQAVAEFAQFKRLPLPRRCAFDVTLTSPQEAHQTPLAEAELFEASNAVAANSPVVARINLGDERTALVFSNAGPAHLADAPLVRLVLDPGEGVWLPDTDVIYGVDHSGKTDLDVWLILKDEGGRMKDEQNRVLL